MRDQPSLPALPDVPTHASAAADAAGEWVVGARAAEAAPAEGRIAAEAAARRRARLEARLAVYARYAAAVGDEAEAAFDGVGDRVRSLAAQRQALEEQWQELREDVHAGDVVPFDAALAGALHELDAQSAVEVALRHRLSALTGVATGAPDAPRAPALLGRGAPPEHQDGAEPLGGRHLRPAGQRLDAHPDPSPAAEAALADADAAARAGALGEAVAGTLGGPLGSLFPGVASRTDPASYRAVDGGASPPAPPRLDLRF